MMEYAAKPPTIPIPFHRLLKVVALGDRENRDVQALVERLTAEKFEVELTDRYERDVAEDAAVGAYIISVDGDAVPEDVDNCTAVANPEQIDTDGDGQGDECDDTPGVYGPDKEGVYPASDSTNVQKSTISGFVFDDADGDVHRDPGEGGVEGVTHDAAHGVLVAVIAGAGEGAAAGVGDLGADRLELVGAPSDEHDGRAQVGQLVRRAAADAATAPGDDVGLAGEQAGTEYRVEGHGLLPLYIRKTPNASLPRTTLLKAALSAMPRTARVSRGSTMPSSHTRAVA